MLDYLNPVSDKFILKTIIDYLNPFSENFILKNVIDFLSNILSYINPFSDNFLGKKIVDLIQNVLEFLFVPDTSEISNRLESIKSKFSFVDDIKYTVSQLSDIIHNTETSKSLTISIPDNKTGINELTIIDLQWYENYKSYGDVIISCIIYIFFLWRVYINLPNIINGVSSFTGDVSSMIVNTTNKGKGG